MPKALLMRSLGGDAYEYVGLISDFKHPDERHYERAARARHLFHKADVNGTAANALFVLSSIAGASGNAALAERLHERATRRWRLQSRRTQQMRDLTERLSRELASRGV